MLQGRALLSTCCEKYLIFCILQGHEKKEYLTVFKVSPANLREKISFGTGCTLYTPFHFS